MASAASDAWRTGHQPGTEVAERGTAERRGWVDWAIRQLEADATRSADTHLHRFPLPDEWGIDLYLKDESVHPTGSLKHRLARSLLLYALCNGWVDEGTTLVEASSGSTAVSEAYFARMLGLPFVAVVPSGTSREKLALIEFHGGTCHLVDPPATVYAEAARVAERAGGLYLDQFTNAERATDWRGNNNIAESVFAQLRMEPHPVPAWIVVGAGTGGTSATFGRYTRYRRLPTKLCVVDPEGSAFFEAWRDDDDSRTAEGSRIEGIGRPRVERSFVPGVVDRMVRVPDAASVAAMNELGRRLGRRVGPSTGTNLWGAMSVIGSMLEAGERGSVVTLICDSGDRYGRSYYDAAWLAERGMDPAPYEAALCTLLTHGRWT